VTSVSSVHPPSSEQIDMASGGGKPQNLGIGLHLETKANGEQAVRDVKPGFDAEAKGLCELPPARGIRRGGGWRSDRQCFIDHLTPAFPQAPEPSSTPLALSR